MPFGFLDVNVLPPRTGAGARVELHSVVEEPATGLHLAFPRGFATHPGAFPRCRLDPAAFSACSSAARTGVGTAQEELGSAPLKLRAYNAMATDGGPAWILQARSGGATVAEIDLRVTHATSGPVLTQLPRLVPGVGLRRLDLTTRRLRTVRRRTLIDFISTASRCPRRGWRFTQTSGTVVATSYAPCTP